MSKIYLSVSNVCLSQTIRQRFNAPCGIDGDACIHVPFRVENHVLILLWSFHFQFSQFLDLLLIKTPCKDCFPSLAKNQKINVIVKT